MARGVDLLEYVLLLSRAGTLIFQSLLLGGVAFLLWVAPAALGITESSLAAVRSCSLNLLRLSTIGLASAQGVSLYANSQILMTAGIGFFELFGANYFIAGSCILLAGLCTYFLAKATARVQSVGLSLVAITVLSASVTTSHAVARVSGRPLLIILTFVHEAATGFWIGGLAFLILALLRAKDRETAWHLTKRFSRMAVICVAALMCSGFLMSLTYIGSSGTIFGTSYGVMLVAKLLMFVALILLGGVNFVLLRKAAPDVALPRISRTIEAELGIGITVILTAVSLTSQPPAVDLANSTVSPHTILTRIIPKVPALTYPARARGEAALLSTTKGIDGGYLSYKYLADAEESEANHHWLGLVVLAMGTLALLARTGKFHWANSWPLLLIAISVFIFLRADTESWPYGTQGFWATWLHAEVFQHRLAGLACCGFAVFELLVRRRGIGDNSRFALVFPMMCAIGGALLLTHTHSLTNTKEEVLAELSHVPMGVLAVIAGWSRWLELRMPATRRIASWIWPSCFVLIAVILLNYREI